MSLGIEAGFGMWTLSCEQLRIMRDFFHLGLIWPNHSLTNSMMDRLGRSKLNAEILLRLK